MTRAHWVPDEDGGELLEFDPPLEMDGAYKAVKLPRLSVGFLVDEWFPVEFMEETKGDEQEHREACGRDRRFPLD